jgi:hypothetical protein
MESGAKPADVVRAALECAERRGEILRRTKLDLFET